MECDQNTAAALLIRALTMALERIFFIGYLCDLPENHFETPSSFLSVPRFIMVLSGVKHMCLSLDHRNVESVELQAGQGLYGMPTNWIHEYWDSEHEMLSISFPPSQTRIVYIKHDGVSPPPLPMPNPTLYYHVPYPLSTVGEAILQALNCIAAKVTPQYRPAGGEELARALMQQVLELTRQPPPKEQSQTLLWREIYNHVSMNFTRPLTRDEIARHFHIHPSHLSRLFRQQLNMGFLEYVNAKRLNLARELLRHPDFNIGSVAQRCGFESTNYFIRVFKKAHKCPPGVYRHEISSMEIVHKSDGKN